MTRLFFVTCAASLLFATLGVLPAHADSGSTYIVQRGDTLLKIAARFGVSVSQLAAANGLRWDSWVYVGQRLVIPGRTGTSSPSTSDRIHVVRRGENLYRISLRYGTTVAAMMAANGLRNPHRIYAGQRLIIPRGTGEASIPATNSSPSGARGAKWIDVDLSTQTLTAYVERTPVLTTRVSTGIRKYPTIVGTFRIYVKYRSARMRGGYGADRYDLPNVPYVMYFYRGYGLHGTYWHNNFGTPMSHGCVNLSTPDAGWLFNWAPVGTKVVTHY
jgi:lipoprotein-anchoring transpeptidase ErfK/SrfK